MEGGGDVANAALRPDPHSAAPTGTADCGDRAGNPRKPADVGSLHEDVAAELAADVAGFLVTTASLDPGFRDRARSLLLGEPLPVVTRICQFAFQDHSSILPPTTPREVLDRPPVSQERATIGAVNSFFARLGIPPDVDTLAGIKRLVSERAVETRHLDFKRQVNNADDLADDLAALANVGGGVLIIGIGTDDADHADSLHEHLLRVIEQQAVQVARDGIR